MKQLFVVCPHTFSPPPEVSVFNFQKACQYYVLCLFLKAWCMLYSLHTHSDPTLHTDLLISLWALTDLFGIHLLWKY